MKRFELIFTFLQLPIDYLMLLLAGASAYALRFSPWIVAIRPVSFAAKLSWERYWPIVALVALGWLIIFAFSGLYSANPNRKLARDLTRVVMACCTGFSAITIYVFFTLGKFDSRFLVLAGWGLAIIFVALGRMLLHGCKALLYRAGVGLRRTVIIGGGSIANTIQNTFASQRRLGFNVVETFPRFSRTNASAMLKLKPDEIIFTDPKGNETETLAAIDWANIHHITFKYSADLFATVSSNMMVSTVAGIPIIELRRTRLTGWGRITKRLFDIIGGLILFTISTPLYLITILIIYIETGRPAIYKNERVGQYGHKFFTFKFRTMYQKFSTGPQFGRSGQAALKTEAKLIKTQNSKSGPIYKIKDDPRITPVGRWLRKWSLDELPQFWNVIKGDMSLVGPRPHQPREVAGYENEHQVVFTIKPGLTGLPQISGRSNLTFEEEIKLDAFYIENWNVYLDFIILVKTPFVVLRKTGSIV
ncbi:MAG: sugar transferase [Candidatus Magasanikbacteria bacterium]|nr:sugar transferase [Candidatus Magasanikbacteria bacterium]